MLALYLYAQFLLVSPSGDYNSKLLHVLDQVKAGLNPFPLILAETIIGLDNFAETRKFSGSPMLLEVYFHLFSLLGLFYYFQLAYFIFFVDVAL